MPINYVGGSFSSKAKGKTCPTPYISEGIEAELLNDGTRLIGDDIGGAEVVFMQVVDAYRRAVTNMGGGQGLGKDRDTTDIALAEDLVGFLDDLDAPDIPGLGLFTVGGGIDALITLTATRTDRNGTFKIKF